MHVALLAYPTIIVNTALETGFTLPPDHASDAEILMEVAGRNCYKSWHRPNADTATNAGYLANIIVQQHFSIMEHAQFVFYVDSVSRAFSHELVRHRQLQFSQVSQRFVDESTGSFVMPLETARSGADGMEREMAAVHAEAVRLYESLVQTLVAAGVPRKRARQAARYVLPNGHATSLVVSGNVRAWREMLGKRLGHTETGEPLADLEFFQFGQWILHLLHEEIPNAVPDLWARYQHWLTIAPDPLLVVRPK